MANYIITVKENEVFMSTLSERLNLHRKQIEGSIKIDVKRDVNAYETLCLYCANNDIDTSEVENSDFDSCAIILDRWIDDARKTKEDAIFFSID